MAAAAVLAVAFPPPTLGGGWVVSLGWGGGACNLQLFSSVQRLHPQAAVDGRRRRGWHRRPSVRLHRELHVHRYLPDGRPSSYEVVALPDRDCDVGRLCSPPRNARAAFADMVQAMMEYSGGLLPDEALEQVTGTVLSYVREVAARAVRSAAAALSTTHVWAVVHVSVVSAEEENTMGGLGYYYHGGEPVTEETQWSLVDGHLVGGDRRATGTEEEEEEEEEEEGEGSEGGRCAICLEGFTRITTEGSDYRRGRRWLPCSHAFHGECVGRWLLRKAECPLCRRQVDAV